MRLHNDKNQTTPDTLSIKEVSGSFFVQLSELCKSVKIDVKNARQKCAENEIPLITFPDENALKKFLSMENAALLLACYNLQSGHLSDETKENIKHFLDSYKNLEPVNDLSTLGLQKIFLDSSGQTTLPDLKNTPPILPENPKPAPPADPDISGKPRPVKPVKLPDAPTSKTPDYLVNVGNFFNQIYKSAAFAYVGMTGVIIGQGLIHGQTAVWAVPNSLPFSMFAMCFLIQTIILSGTVHAEKLTGMGYTSFLLLFFVYDAGFNACNFFRDFDPTNLFSFDSAGKGIRWPDKINAVSMLVARFMLTISFPLATLFFAQLIRRLRQV